MPCCPLPPHALLLPTHVLLTSMQTTFPEFNSLDLTPGYTGVLLEAETEDIHNGALDSMASDSCHVVFKVMGMATPSA